MPFPSSEQLQTVAVRAARQAGELILRGLGQDREALGIRSKAGATDLITEVDQAAERVILQAIERAFPTHAILAEESGGQGSAADLQWVVDPLDGTTNFAHGHPHCAVSIACLRDGVPDVAVIFDPARDELFTARQGEGAWLNGRRCRVSAQSDLAHGLLATGFAYDRRERADHYVPIFHDFLCRSRGVRRMGAASLDLAWLAVGRVDGFWEFGLNPWDIAAGVLLIEEAGGHVSDYAGAPLAVLDSDYVVASNGSIHAELLAVLKEHEALW